MPEGLTKRRGVNCNDPSDSFSWRGPDISHLKKLSEGGYLTSSTREKMKTCDTGLHPCEEKARKGEYGPRGGSELKK